MSYPNTQLLIDGQWQDAADGRTLPVLNPATGAEIGRVAHAGIADLDRALAAAQKGFEAWRDVPAIERAFGIQFLAKDVYYISDLPSELQWADVITISSVSFVLTLVATLYPSWRASRLNPAEALRYE